jgi:peptide/nickel transport system substrate-binding protein
VKHFSKWRSERRDWRQLSGAVIACSLASVVVIGPLEAGAASNTTIVVPITYTWPSLDPMVDATTAGPWAIIRPGYDFFVGLSKDGTQFIPYLATAWKQTPRSIAFTLRRDAKCADGHVLTAVDMLNSVKRFILVKKRSGSPASASPGGLGPGPYHLHANNSRSTLTLSVDHPWRNFLALFASLPVICPSGLAAAKNTIALDGATYGSGPYTLASLEPTKQLVWKLRPEWKWGPPGTSTARMPQTIEMPVVADQTTVANMLITGQANYAQVNGPDVERLRASDSFLYVQAHNWLVSGLVFNMRPGRPFALGDGDSLRTAIALALDPKAFNQAAFGGLGVPVPSQFRPGAECYSATLAKSVPAASIDAAKRALQVAGYTGIGGRLAKNGQTAPKITLLSSTAVLSQAGDYVLSILNQLGFDVQLNDAPSAYSANAVNGNFDILVQQGTRPFNEPGANMSPQFGPPTPTGINLSDTGDGDPLWNRYYNAGLQNLGKGSCKYFDLVQKINLKNHYVVPLTAPNFHEFARRDVIASVPAWSNQAAGMPWYWVQMK